MTNYTYCFLSAYLAQADSSLPWRKDPHGGSQLPRSRKSSQKRQQHTRCAVAVNAPCSNPLYTAFFLGGGMSISKPSGPIYPRDMEHAPSPLEKMVSRSWLLLGIHFKWTSFSFWLTQNSDPTHMFVLWRLEPDQQV